jgi:PASTA domain
VRTINRSLLVAAIGALAAAGLAGQSVALAAPHAAQAARHVHQPVRAGSAKASPRSVNLRHVTRKLQAEKAAAAAQPRAPRFDLITPTGADVTSEFDGITQVSSGGSDRPDPSSATNGSQIVETAGRFLQVFDNNGATMCGTGTGLTLNQFLGTGDTLAGQHVEYDNFQGHFIVDAAVVDTSASAAPALWIAVSNTSNPCQTWNTYRLTFSGGPYIPGAVLDSTILGQDRRAVLVEANLFATTGGAFQAYSVFAITKSDLYADNAVSFPTFTVASQAAPASNAGEPMIDSQFSYFLGADPQAGYQLYRMSGSGTSSPGVTLAATIGSPYSAPQQALQPPDNIGPDAGDGRMTSSPAYDGSRIWFAHGVSQIFHPTSVRFGYVNLASNTETKSLMTVDPLFSYEVNGSVGVGLNADGTEAIFLNWAYTDPSHGVNVSPAIDSFVFNGSVPSTFGNQQTLLTGTPIGTTNFGEFSSVAVDPNKSGVTTCAVTTQEYFDQTWNTRLARVCSPVTVDVPVLTGDTVGQAATVLAGLDEVVGPQASTTNCDPSANGTITATSPAGGQPVPLGSSVGLTVCTATPAPTTVAVPSVIGDTVPSATSALQAAGLVVGSIGSTTSCDVAKNTIATQSPQPGDVVAIGSAVRLSKSVGRPKTPCP